ncbi:MAG: hypothetical protein L7S45_05580, partial [Luminiphilus sp.]|nr:hypothetical protein [Luminiphilus sp.]
GSTPNDNAGSPIPALDQLQPIGDASAVLGYLNMAGVGPEGQTHTLGDIEDYYVIEAIAGTIVSLEIGDPEHVDIDLWLYTEQGAYVTDSSSRYPGDSIEISEAGRYIINAHLFSGYGSYILTIDRPTALDSVTTSPITTIIDNPAILIEDETPVQDVGELYVLLIDADTMTVEAVSTTTLGLKYSYHMVLPQSGNYFLVAGTDIDSDLALCDPEDICGLYGSSNSIVEPIVLTGGVSNLDILIPVQFGVYGSEGR